MVCLHGLTAGEVRELHVTVGGFTGTGRDDTVIKVIYNLSDECRAFGSAHGINMDAG